MSVFKFSTARSAKLDVKRSNPRVRMTENEPPIGNVQGRKPQSVQEWRVALALWKLKLNFEYQFSIAGGTTTLGGQVVDFWVYTAPLPTPVYVQGEYWHRAQKHLSDLLKQQQVISIFKGQILPPIELEENELDSAQEAYETVRRRLLAL